MNNNSEEKFFNPPSQKNITEELILSREKAINVFKFLQDNIFPRPGQEFCVITYFLTDEISPEGSRGMWFLIGTYPNDKMAIKKAKSVIQKTGLKSTYAMKTCSWEDINDKFQPNRIFNVPYNLNAKLKKQHQKEYEKLFNQVKKDREINQEISNEKKLELDPETVEYYTHQWYLIIRLESHIEELQKNLKDTKEKLMVRKTNLLLAYEKHPDYEIKWIKQLENRLPKRDEEKLLKFLKEQHEILKKEIFN